MNEPDNFALVPRPPGTLQKAEPGAQRILSGMVADMLALAAPALVETWLVQGKNSYFGYGVSRNYGEAFTLFSKAAAAGHPEAQFHVALCFEDGDGVKPDKVQAVEWYRKSAIGGFAKAQNNLAICFRDGKGTPHDFGEANRWYQMAAEQGYAPASCRPKNESRPYGLTCEQLSSSGLNLGLPEQSSKVQEMGFYYRFKFDHGAPRDGAEAVKWYRKEAERGCADAQTNLGVCYEFRHDVPQDIVEAANWYRMAAEQDCADAQNKLIVGIQSGRIVPLDGDEEWKWYGREEKSQVVKWMRKGAERGDAGDQFAMGLFSQKGVGVPRDTIEAYKWFKLADAQDFQKPAKMLTSLLSTMTPAQIQEGEQRFREFKPTHESEKNCLPMNEPDEFALVPRPPGALQKIAPGQERILSGMVADTLALVKDGPTSKLDVHVLTAGGPEFSEFFPLAVTLADDQLKTHFVACQRMNDLTTALSQNCFDLALVQFHRSPPAEHKFGNGREILHRVESLIAENGYIVWAGLEVAYFLQAVHKIPVIIISDTGKEDAESMQATQVGARALFSWLKLDFPAFHSAVRTILLQGPKQTVPKLPRIVVVDDDTELLQIIEAIFREVLKDISVATFQTGEAAIAELLRSPPDLLISDLVRPALDGYEMLQWLAQTRARYPILIISGNLPTNEAKARRCVGPDLDVTFWSKPVHPQQLSEFIRAKLRFDNPVSA